MPPIPNACPQSWGAAKVWGAGDTHPFIANPALDFVPTGWAQALLDPHPHLLGPPQIPFFFPNKSPMLPILSRGGAVHPFRPLFLTCLLHVFRVFLELYLKRAVSGWI